MISSLFVAKKFGIYADTFLMLGLALLAEYALNKTKQTTQIQLIDEGTHYRIQFTKPVNLEPIALIPYANPFLPVCGQKTDRSKLPPETDIFDVVFQGEIRKLYREYLYQNHPKVETGEDTPKPPHPSTQNGAILISMRHDKNHNDLWLQGWEQRDNYGALVASILKAFSQKTHSTLKAETEQVADLFKQATGCQLPNLANAYQLGEMEDNEHILLGRHLHRNIDEEGISEEEGTVVYRQQWVWSDRLFVSGIIDAVEEKDGELVPVEYKKGLPFVRVWTQDVLASV